jgi:hypothetical protein
VRKFLVGAGVVALLGIAAALGAFGDLDAADADEQEKTATACLRAAGLEVKSEIPPYGRGGTPEYELDVDATDGDQGHLAFVFLFDSREAAELYTDELRSDAETEPAKGVTIEQRGSAAMTLYADAAEAARIRACVDKASKPPPDKE